MFPIPSSLLVGCVLPFAAPPPPPALPCRAGLVLLDRGDDQYNFIAGLYDRGLHSMVVKEGEKFLAEFADHGRAPLVRYRVGQSHFEQQQYAPCRTALLPLEALGERFQYQKEAVFRIAQCSLELGEADDAARRFTALAQDPEHYLYASAAYFGGEALFQRESYEAAAKSYAKVLEAGADAGMAQGALYGLGWSLYRSQQYATAAKTFQLFLQRHPDDAAAGEIRFLQGESYSRVGQYEQALGAYLAVPRGDFQDDALSAAGFAAAELDRPAEAAQLFLRLEREAPDSELLAEARLHAGIQCVRADDLPRAGEVLDRLLKGSEKEWLAEARYWRGQVAAKLEGPDAALEQYALGKAETEDEELLRRLELATADALFDAGRFDAAQAIYDSMQGDASDALYSSAVAALNAGNADMAIARSRQLLQESPDSPHALGAQLVLAEGLFAKKDYDASTPAFARIEELTRSAPGEAPHPERPRALSRWAWSLFYQEDYAEAAQRFSQLGNEFPRDERSAEASFLEGRCLLRAGKNADAERVLRQHLEAYPGTQYDDDARYDLAQSLLEQGRDKEAQEMLATVADGAEGLGLRARFEQAELAAAAGENQKAVQLLLPILDAEEAPADLLRASLYAHAWSCYALERWDDARKSLRRLLSDAELAGNTRPSALELLTTVETRAGNADAAVQAYQYLVQVDPEGARTPEVALQATVALKNAGKTAEAIGLLQDARQRWPEFGGMDRLLYELAFLHKAAGDVAASVACLQELEESMPTSDLAADAAFYRAEELFDAGRFDEAQSVYARALEPDSRVRDLARYKTAWAAFRAERRQEAATNFTQVHRDHPESKLAGESLFLAGECLYQDGSYPEARRQLELFVQQYPEHESRAKGLFRLGLCQGEMGDYSAALETLSRLERESPDFEHRTEVHLWIGRAHLAAQQLDEADRRFQKVLDEDRGLLAARAHLGRGDVLILRDRVEDALGEYLKVALLYQDVPEVAEALWHAGRCLERMGDPDRAARQYRDLLEQYPQHPRAAEAGERLAEIGSGGHPKERE